MKGILFAATLTLAVVPAPVHALNNGIGLVPVMGWTSWEPGIDFAVNASVLLRAADGLESSGLKDMGYTYVLIDDGWPSCMQFSGRGSCITPTERLEDGTVIIDEKKFPPSSPGANDGIKIVADKLHAQGFKIGIYTAPHGQTCGGFWGMSVAHAQAHPTSRHSDPNPRPPSLLRYLRPTHIIMFFIHYGSS